LFRESRLEFAYGPPRLTVDVDLVVDLDEGQALRAIDALVKLGLRPRVPVNPRDFADRSVREAWIRDRGMQVFSMFDPDRPQDRADIEQLEAILEAKRKREDD
jgi:hypothetical protein